MTNFIQNHTGLFVLCIVGVVLLISAVILLGIFVFKPLGLKKQLRNIDKRFQSNHSLLTGQDSQNVKKLEIISRTNLLYVEIHTKFLRQLKEITENNDSVCETELNKLRDTLSDKKFKEFLTQYKHVVNLVDEFEKVLNDYTIELSKVVKPEEDCRKAALEQKECLRHIKQEYYSKETELSLISESFTQLFEYIDDLFKKFDEYVDSAQYDDAKKMLSTIEGFLSELGEKITILPELCMVISNIVPEKNHKIELLYKEMLEERYPLQNLSVNQTLAMIKSSCEEYVEKIKQFDTDGIKEGLNEILTKLDSFSVNFEKEKEARKVFEEKSENVYEFVNSIEREYIRLRNDLPEVSKIFVINEDHQAKFKTLQKDVNRVGGLKRTLDTYIHSVTKQPFSILVTKINEIESLNSVINEELEAFNLYLSSLKSDAEHAYETVFSTFSKIKKGEELLRLINLNVVYEKYELKIEQLYSLLSEINELLVTQPIDVDKVNSLLVDLNEQSNTLLDEGEIAQDYNMMVLAENSIVYGNKHRNNLVEIDQLLSQAEVFFENGNFEEAYKISANALRKIKQSNGK